MQRHAINHRNALLNSLVCLDWNGVLRKPVFTRVQTAHNHSGRARENAFYVCALWEEIVHMHTCRRFRAEAPVAQWLKRWPTDLAVPSSSPARCEIFCTQPFIIIHILSWYDCNTIEKDVKSQITHPSVPSWPLYRRLILWKHMMNK